MEKIQDAQYEAPAIAELGRYSDDTADNRPWIGWDWYVSRKNS